MNKGLIHNLNSRIKLDDTIVHVGDFCCKGNEKGVSGTKTKAQEWRQQLHGNWIFIEGNHDRNNGLKFGIISAVIPLGGMLVFVQHRPIERACEVPDFCDLVICGHIHEKWKEKWIDGILNVNVGIDAHRFNPISDSELIGIISKAKRSG